MNATDKFIQFLYNKNKHGMELISLLFTLFYFFPLYFYPELSAVFVIKILLLYALLFTTLLGCAFAPREKKPLVAYLLVVLTTLSVSFYIGANSFYAFAVFYLAMHQKLTRAFLGLFFTLGCVVFAAYQFNLAHAYFILPTIIPSSILFLFGIFERKDQEHKKREAFSSQQLERMAAVAERERIARDLHDVLGHTLTSIALKSQLAEKQLEAGEIQAAKKEIREVAEITSNTLTEVRQAISGYKSMTINDRLEQLKDRL